MNLDLGIKPWVMHVIMSVVVIIICFVIYKVLTYLVFKRVEKKFNNKKTKTYLKHFRSIVRYTFIIIVVLIVLQINGVNVSSLMAGVGIIGIVIGFAIQDALKDIIKGIDIITDSYYQVGDVIKYNNNIGKVLTIGLKTTKIEDINTNNVVSISNRNIDLVEVVSNLICINLPLPYELKVDDAEKIITDIIDDMKNVKDLDNCEYSGINELDSSSVNYLLKMYCEPVKKKQVRRDCLGCIMRGLEKHNISVPYNKIDVYQK